MRTEFFGFANSHGFLCRDFDKVHLNVPSQSIFVRASLPKTRYQRQEQGVVEDGTRTAKRQNLVSLPHPKLTIWHWVFWDLLMSSHRSRSSSTATVRTWVPCLITGGRDGWEFGLGTSWRMNGSWRYCLLTAESFAIAASESVWRTAASGSAGAADGGARDDGGSISRESKDQAEPNMEPAIYYPKAEFIETVRAFLLPL